jgi:molybdopterin-guanine dinucleotide biosynthesis protein A
LQIGLVLSGGKSSRMGKDKAAVEIGGSTMLEHSMSLLNSLVLDKVVLSGSADGYPDIFPDKGPVGGIYSAIVNLSLKEGDLVLIIPNDMPLMRSNVLSQLLEQSLNHQCTYIFKRHPMPLCLYISENVLAQCQLLESVKGMSIKQLIEADKVGELAVKDDSVFINVNTPQELEDVIQTLQEMRP